MNRAIRKMGRAARVAFVLTLMAAGVAARAQEAVPPETAVPAKDILDVLKELRHKPPKSPADLKSWNPKRVMYAGTPYIAANSSNGFIVGVAGNVAFFRGDPKTTRISAAVASLSITSKGQLLLSSKLAGFAENNKWFIDGDNRLNLTSQDTYGLGPNTPSSASVDTKFNFFRVYETVYRRVFQGFYAGAGFLFGAHTNIRPAKEAESVWPQSPFVMYSERNGFNLTSQTSAGASINGLFDNRDSSINPSRGWYASAVYRFFLKGFLGGTSAWQELDCDLRKYVRLGKSGRNKLAFWFYGNFVTSGIAPYFDLPATGMDTYSRSGRGYLQGRFRGEQMVYGEIEYRWTITRNGLLGLVAFLNTETLSNKQAGEHLFSSFATGAGLGLRLLVNKHSKTNLCLDLGVGKNGSYGVYVAVQEAF